MARSRIDLHTILLGFCERVYFQPPPNVQMVYPAIVYSRDDADVDYASNGPYRSHKRYQVTVIDRDPDSEIPDKISTLPLCAFDRHFKEDDLNHDVFNIFF